MTGGYGSSRDLREEFVRGFEPKLYLHARPDRSSSYYVDDASGFRGDANRGDKNG